MSDEIKLPQTVEEFQRARREAFLSGIAYSRSGVSSCPSNDPHTCEWCEEEARRRYPIRKRVPRVVKISRGRNVQLSDGELQATFETAPGMWTTTDMTPDDVRALAELLNNPFTEVEE